MAVQPVGAVVDRVELLRAVHGALVQPPREVEVAVDLGEQLVHPRRLGGRQERRDQPGGGGLPEAAEHVDDPCVLVVGRGRDRGADLGEHLGSRPAPRQVLVVGQVAQHARVHAPVDALGGERGQPHRRLGRERQPEVGEPVLPEPDEVVAVVVGRGRTDDGEHRSGAERIRGAAEVGARGGDGPFVAAVPVEHLVDPAPVLGQVPVGQDARVGGGSEPGFALVPAGIRHPHDARGRVEGVLVESGRHRRRDGRRGCRCLGGVLLGGGLLSGCFLRCRCLGDWRPGDWFLGGRGGWRGRRGRVGVALLDLLVRLLREERGRVPRRAELLALGLPAGPDPPPRHDHVGALHHPLPELRRATADVLKTPHVPLSPAVLLRLACTS
jgi:hypothetical protein